MSAILFAIQAANLIKAAIAAGMAAKDVYDMIDKSNAQLKTFEDENRAPTDAEWDALNAESERLRELRQDV